VSGFAQKVLAGMSLKRPGAEAPSHYPENRGLKAPSSSVKGNDKSNNKNKGNDKSNNKNKASFSCKASAPLTRQNLLA
jgi:hypothetical protein